LHTGGANVKNEKGKRNEQMSLLNVGTNSALFLLTANGWHHDVHKKLMSNMVAFASVKIKQNTCQARGTRTCAHYGLA